MTPHEGIPARLARLLETLEPAERQEIVAWLLATPRWGGGSSLRREIASWLPSGEGSQLVTIRLPMEQHERLRTWCGEHNFTMAAVVRGLVERFLDEQGARPATPSE